MAFRNGNQCDVRIICNKNDADSVAAVLIEGMKRANYKLLKFSDPRPSRKSDSDVLIYSEFLEDS